MSPTISVDRDVLGNPRVFAGGHRTPAANPGRSDCSPMKASIAPPTLQQRLAERGRPQQPVVMHQRWEQLLFLHWRFDAEAVQRTLPPGLYVDTFEHAAWIGLTPLFMRNVRPRFAPPVPLISDFLELNLRTYVYDERGRPGLYFFSLDCDQPLVVETARKFLNLPYEHAAMQAKVAPDGLVEFTAQRTGTSTEAKFQYRSIGEPERAAEPGSQEFFLFERYRLFASDGAGENLTSVQVAHEPYRLRLPIVLEWSSAMLDLAGFEVEGRSPDHVRAADPLEVEVFAPERVGVES